MKRHVPGLHEQASGEEEVLEGAFLVQVERAFYKHHAHKPFFSLRFKSRVMKFAFTHMARLRTMPHNAGRISHRRPTA